MKRIFASGIFISLVCQITFAGDFPRVDADLKTYDDTVAAKNTTFNRTPADPSSKDWVKSKLSHMVDVDQYMRTYSDIPFQHSYNYDETVYFRQQFGPRWFRIDQGNTDDLKTLLLTYN